MNSLLKLISDYEEGERKARVYLEPDGKFAVSLYDCVDFHGTETFTDLDEAEDFAEDWVLNV